MSLPTVLTHVWITVLPTALAGDYVGHATATAGSPSLLDRSGHIDFTNNRIEEVPAVSKELARWAQATLYHHHPGCFVRKAVGYQYVTSEADIPQTSHMFIFVVDNITSSEEHQVFESYIKSQTVWHRNIAKDHPYALKHHHAALLHDGASDAEKLLLTRMTKIVQRLMPDAVAYNTYTNRHDMSQPGLPHADEATDSSRGVTALYYTSADARLPAAGYTIFFDAAVRKPLDEVAVLLLDMLEKDDEQQRSGSSDSSSLSSDFFEVALAVRPLPRRLVIFDSRLLHQALPPSVSFPRARYSTAIKFRSKMAGELMNKLHCSSSKVQQVVETLCTGEH